MIQGGVTSLFNGQLVFQGLVSLCMCDCSRDLVFQGLMPLHDGSKGPWREQGWKSREQSPAVGEVILGRKGMGCRRESDHLVLLSLFPLCPNLLVGRHSLCSLSPCQIRSSSLHHTSTQLCRPRSALSDSAGTIPVPR